VKNARDNQPPELDPSFVQSPERLRSEPILSTPSQITTVAAPPATPPNISDAPATFVTPPTPTDTKFSSSDIEPPEPNSKTESKPSPTKATNASSSTANLLAHRRSRSATNPPSKLSNSISAPLSPTIEEAKTPGGTVTTPSGGGFFSSVFSAAQTAANQLSNTLANANPGKGNKTATQATEKDDSTHESGEEVIFTSKSIGQQGGAEKPRAAIETIGSGNLTLGHLGISDTEQSPMTSNVDLTASAGSEPYARTDESAASQAVSAAYSADRSTNDVNDRPRSISQLSGTQTPPRTQSNGPDVSSIKRSGSVRSRISGGRKRRHRGSSATTGNTVAAAISATTSAITNPASQSTRPTGFAVASAKRNKDFHQLFRSVPDDDLLIEDYSAALQRDILLQGRLYVSEGHVCFYSNIVGWVTTLVISFDEVVSVEKKNTAVIFPNAIVIQTLHARNVFASFVTRDTTYDLLINIWRVTHPNLKSSLNGVTLDAGTGDKTEKAESVNTDEASDDEDASEDEVYDEDEDEEEMHGSFADAPEGSVAGSEVVADGKSISRKTSAVVGDKTQNGLAKTIEASDTVVTAASSSQDFPGPVTHLPSDCGDSATHYDKLLIDTVIAAPLGKIYSLVFGPASGSFMRKWLVEEQKSLELQMEDDKQGLGEANKSRSYQYIKPLSGAIGPKQTRCLTTEQLDQFDLEKAVSVTCSTQNPDVPSGNVFTVKTKYCLMWAANNSTRLIMTFTIEWSGKSWIKGPIEKGANDGQGQYARELVTALRAAVTKTSTPKVAAKGKAGKRRRKETADTDVVAAPVATATPVQTPKSNWGMFEPLHPVVDIVKTVINMPIAAAFLSLLVVYLWLFRAAQPAPGSLAFGGLGSGMSMTPTQRIQMYEAMWRREENELWEWMEERVSLDRDVRSSTDSSSRSGKEGAWFRKRQVDHYEQVTGNEDMSQRQMEEAIRITQEKLNLLREAVERKKGKAQDRSEKDKKNKDSDEPLPLQHKSKKEL
jgi:hypothetical protein